MVHRSCDLFDVIHQAENASVFLILSASLADAKETNERESIFIIQEGEKIPGVKISKTIDQPKKT